MYAAFNAAFASLDGDDKSSVVEKLYHDMGTCRFSKEVLSRCSPGLAVKRIDDVEPDDIAQVAPTHTRAIFVYTGLSGDA